MKKGMIYLAAAVVFFSIPVFLTGCTRKVQQPDGLDEIALSGNVTLSENTVSESPEGVPKETDADNESGGGRAENRDEGPAGDGGASPEEESSKQPCYVYICGAVQVPGVYEMEAGDRIFTVIERAGGFTEAACTDYVNQALSVVDGLRIRIPTVQEAKELKDGGEGDRQNPLADDSGLDYPKGTAGLPDDGAEETPGGLVNINTAAKEQLCTLTGIGERKAEAIIAYRREHGDFSQKEDIMKVAGIKQAGYEKIKEQIIVD